MRILVAEDNRSYCRALSAILEHDNYTVDAVFNGADALEYGIANLYDGIIMDLMMPDIDGMEVIRRLRAANVTTPVMILTAKTQIGDRIEGYDAGADDYMSKPFHSEELLARVRALLRRRPSYRPNTLSFAGLTLDGGDHSVSGPNGQLKLTSKEFQILELLMRDPGRAVSTEEFCKRVWCWEDMPDMSVVRVHISSLRKKVDQVCPSVTIRGERGVGYSLRKSSL
ncbi:MAG: response regulator transcription factor [Oscillospiraceae bacterium]